MSGNYKKKSAQASYKLNLDTDSLPHDVSDDFDELFTPSSIETIVEYERTQASKEATSQDLSEQNTEFSSEELSAGELEADLDDEHGLETYTDDEMVDIEVQPAEFSSSNTDHDSSSMNYDSSGMDYDSPDMGYDSPDMGYDSSDMDYEAEAEIEEASGWVDTPTDLDIDHQSQAVTDFDGDAESQTSEDYAAQFEIPSNEDEFDIDIQPQTFADSNVDNEIESEPVVEDTPSVEHTPTEEVQGADFQSSASSSAAYDEPVKESLNTKIDQSLAENVQLSAADKKEIKKHLKHVLTKKLLDSIDSQLDSLAFDPGNDIKPDMNPDNLKQTYRYNLTPFEYGYIYQQEKTKPLSSINARGEGAGDDSVSKPYELTEELDLDCGFSEEETEEFNDIDEEELVEQLSQLPSSEPKVKTNYNNFFLIVFLIVILISGVHGYYQSDQISDFISNIENNINTFTDNVEKNVSSLRSRGS